MDEQSASLAPKRQLAFRQADLVRVLKSAKAAGAAQVLVRLDGSFVIEFGAEVSDPGPAPKRREIIL